MSITFHGSQVFILNAWGGASIAGFLQLGVGFTPDGKLTQLGSAATGQAATCWIAAAPEGTLYASNAGSAAESTLATEPDGVIAQLGTTPTDDGTTDAAVSSDGRYLYVQAGAAGNVDAYRIGRAGTLTETGSVTVPSAVGGEGIAAS